jgi:membrane fusion protein, multidrug efflux system
MKPARSFGLFALSLLVAWAAVAQESRPAKIVEAVSAAAADRARYPGQLQAAEEADLTFPVGGRLVELPVIEGQAVLEGDLVARLEEPRLEARLASAQAEAERARGDFRRGEELIRSGVLTRRELESRQATLEVAEAALAEALEDVEATRLTAPFTGIVARRHAEVFQNVRAHESIVTLQDLSRLDVLVHVPARAVLEARGEERPARVAIDGLEGRTFPAAVRSIATQPDPVTQTYAVLLRLERPRDVTLLPGMPAVVLPAEDETKRVDPVVLLPAAAVIADATGAPFVWRVDLATGAVSRQPVTLGSVRGGDVEIVDGVEPGDRVVGAGLSHIREGMVVRPLDG